MEKTKLGISIEMLGAILYVSVALFGYFGLLVVGGYIVFIEKQEFLKKCVGKAVDALKEVDGVMFICADHGNAEQLVDYETGEPFTAHTTNPVPFILVNYKEGVGLREGGCLADIVPTLIEMMGMTQPAEMTGKSLLV